MSNNNNRVVIVPFDNNEETTVTDLQAMLFDLDITEPINTIKRLILLNNKSPTVVKLLGSIDKLRSLEELYVISCNLTFLPVSVCKLKELRILNLTNNSLKHLPNEIVNLTNLRELDLSHTLFEELPLTISQMKSIKILHLNRLLCIKDFEVEITKLIRLSKLKILYITHNLINAIPDSLLQLTQLETLDISNNFIKELPLGLLNLKKLRLLNINENSLKTLPLFIIYMQYLKFEYQGNNIHSELHPAVSRWLHACNNVSEQELPLTQNGYISALRFINKYTKDYNYSDKLKTSELMKALNQHIRSEDKEMYRIECRDHTKHMIYRLTFKEMLELLLLHYVNGNNLRGFKNPFNNKVPYAITKIN
jgi:Leucine-rich repeat (LRR) protein